MRTAGDAPVTINRLSEPLDMHAELSADVMSGLTSSPKAIPSKYFYDGVGSELFEEITKQPEYYLTNAERELLETHAAEIMAVAQPQELVEVGSGSSIKTRLLIDAMHEVGGTRYVPIDISEDALRGAAADLCAAYTWLEIDALIGDFHTDLPKAPRKGRRLVVFLGSTIGNLQGQERTDFMNQVSMMLEPGDMFLLGVDTVKDIDVLIAAYNDAAGVTAQFTRNVLNVVNRELDADFDVSSFEHVPHWNEACECMEAWLRATRPMTVNVGQLNLTVEIEKDEMIHTEVSCKFTDASIARLFEDTDIAVERTFRASENRFALVLGRRT